MNRTLGAGLVKPRCLCISIRSYSVVPGEIPAPLLQSRERGGKTEQVVGVDLSEAPFWADSARSPVPDFSLFSLSSPQLRFC